MIDLAHKRCVACEGGTPPLVDSEIKKFLVNLEPDWTIEQGKLTRKFKFRDFKEAMVFVNSVAEIAEKEWHHPDISIYFNNVGITLYTHSIKGLSENDFILAAKIDTLGYSVSKFQPGTE